MTRFGVALCLAISLSASLGTLRAADDEEDSDVAAAADAQDLLLLGPNRPLIVRLQITVEANPLNTGWRERFERLLTVRDADQDGSLTVDEALAIADLMSGQLDFSPLRGQFQKELEQLAREVPGRRLESERVRSFLLQKFPSFRLASGLAEGGGAAPALYPLLDANGDGRLSAEELGSAFERLAGRDFDDDQVLTELELVSGPPPAEQSTPAAASESAESAIQAGIVVVLSAASGPRIAEILVKRYDRNADGVLDLASRPPELPRQARNFARLDANDDQKLDAAELAHVPGAEPDLELPFAFGRDARTTSNRTKNRAAAEFRVRAKLTGGYKMQLAELDIDLRRNNRNLSLNAPMELDFARFDGDNNGYLDQGECRGRLSFATADGDHDKKVSPVEFRSFLDAQSLAANSRVVLQVFDRGQDLYAMLDENGDGVLTARELHDAKDLIPRADTDGDTMLSPGEIPQRMQLELSRDGLTTLVVFQQRPPRPRPVQAKASRTGPRWFQKMDHNGDGDVSRMEFLGSLDVFTRIDTDGDGLISAAEAEKFKPS